jgi:hypothetical protein
VDWKVVEAHAAAVTAAVATRALVVARSIVVSLLGGRVGAAVVLIDGLAKRVRGPRPDPASRNRMDQPVPRRK